MNDPPTARFGLLAGGETGFVANKVQQKIDTQLPLPPLLTIFPESHPCVGACQRVRVFVTAVTRRQVESQDRGKLDIVHALVVLRVGLRVHLAIQHHKIRLLIAANG